MIDAVLHVLASFQAGHLSTSFAHALRGLTARNTFVGICGSNRNETAIADFACALAGCVSVGIHSTYDPTGAAKVINNAELSVIVVDRERFPLIAKALPQCPSVRHVVLMDDKDDWADSHPALLPLLASVAVRQHIFLYFLAPCLVATLPVF